MRLHLFWLDKKWKGKGCADNYNLVVDMENKKRTQNDDFIWKKKG